MGTVVSLEKEVSCRVTNSIIRYVESLGYNTDCLVEGLPYPKEYLADPFNWVTWDVRETMCRRAANLVGNEAIMYQVGLATPKLNPLGGIEDVVRLLGSPKIAYTSVPKYAIFFDKIFKFETSIVGANKAVVTMLLSKDYAVSKSSCYYAQGILAAIPTVWGLPPAEVQEKQCRMVRRTTWQRMMSMVNY